MINDIITHQSGQRTASDKFAASLALELGESFKASPNGAYTDTNEYKGLVAECTNISVDYFSQHTSSERQDVEFLIALREALLQVDWTQLVVDRDPATVEWDDFGGGFWGSSFRGRRKESDQSVQQHGARMIYRLGSNPMVHAPGIVAWATVHY